LKRLELAATMEALAFGSAIPAALIGLAVLSVGGLLSALARKVIRNLPTAPAGGLQLTG
jgi:hypothetical protein